MEIHEHIAWLDREGPLLLDAVARTALTTPVPPCPAWTLRDLLAHIGFVHRWATSYIVEALTERVDRPGETGLLAEAPSDERLRDWVREGHAALVHALSNAPADLRCWTFLDAPSPLAFWARRQAHETTMHRVDAEIAASREITTIDPSLAVDGIDELLFGFMSRGRRESKGDLVGTAALVVTDEPSRWTLQIWVDHVEAQRGADGADATIFGSARDLYVWLWNRRPTAGLEVTGRAELLDQWGSGQGLTWS
ncbi:MAG TPA: maleylpyruvate isomerase family mycothiol-dependent enzyme [Acidimicrobiales bacterium]|nr:maleylpyruvate isomerase family mycothiol-dependent enzyme [Acidimicrobiales bacterium]